MVYYLNLQERGFKLLYHYTITILVYYGSKNFNTELSKVSDWLMLNKLNLNLLHQSKKNTFWKSIYLYVKIIKTIIKKTNSYKYLGTTKDRILNWSKHIEPIKSKLQKTLVYYIKQYIS